MADETNRNVNEQPQAQDMGELLRIRRDKLKVLQDEGRDPFTITRFDVTHHTQDIKDNFDAMFGPAYKGIPLAVVTAIAYHELYGKEVKYCCDRKEAKDHGADKGNLLGYEPQDGDRVIMVEDVTTSGKSIDETYPKVKAAADVEIKGLIVSLNRMEVGKGGVTTAQKEIEAKYGFPVASIVSMAEVVETLYNHEIDGKVVIDDELKTAIDAYYEQYGVRE